VRRVLAGVLVATACAGAPVSDGSGAPDDKGPPRHAADERNGQAFIQDNLWTEGDHQFAVMVDHKGNPIVARRSRTGGPWETALLGDLPGNPLAAPTADDEHNVYVIAVDGRGHVHVMGNMHNDPLRYVRSTSPMSIDAWEAAAIAGPARRVTYPQLVDVAGSLLFFRREGESGDGAILLDVLDRGARDWRHAGVVLDGAPSGESPYLHEVAVGRDGAVHLLFTWRGSADRFTTNDVGHLVSRDAGRTWTDVDGRTIGTPVTHRDAPVVIDTPATGSGLLNQGGLAVDDLGHPHAAVVFDRQDGSRVVEHVWHDGRAWRRAVVEPALRGRPAVAVAGSRVWFVGTRCRVLVARAVTGGTETVRLGAVPSRWEVSLDAGALRLGRVEALVPDGRMPAVRSIDLDDRPPSEADPC